MMFDPATELERCKMCKSPVESNIRNFFADTAWIEIAFKDMKADVVELKPSAFLLLNATKYASLESCLHLTDLCFTASLNEQSTIKDNARPGFLC